jgi:hypothetical protein
MEGSYDCTEYAVSVDSFGVECGGNNSSPQKKKIILQGNVNLDAGWRLILKWALEKEDGVIWTGFRIGTNGGLL